MSFEILTANGAAAQRWVRYIQGLPPQLRDIHFLPEYGCIHGDSYGFEPLLALYESSDGIVLQPFMRRQLGELPFLAGQSDAAKFSDIANPYGYGGPLCNVAGPAQVHRIYRQFAEAFTQWCDDEGIASEFASLHPLMADYQRAMIGDILKPHYEKDVVIVELCADEADILKKMRKGHRSSVNLARRSGVTVKKVEMNTATISLFADIYYQTMSRRQAAARWFVPDDYFENYVRHLGPSRVSLFFAYIGEEIESACLLMHEYSSAYYHFAGTRAQHPELGANNLMVYEAAIWAKRAGYARLHLGGGVTSSADDGLLRFKAGFSSRRAPLYTYFCIRDRLVYDELCERKHAYEYATSGTLSTSEFQPLYRR